MRLLNIRNLLWTLLKLLIYVPRIAKSRIFLSSDTNELSWTFWNSLPMMGVRSNDLYSSNEPEYFKGRLCVSSTGLLTLRLLGTGRLVAMFTWAIPANDVGFEVYKNVARRGEMTSSNLFSVCETGEQWFSQGPSSISGESRSRCHSWSVVYHSCKPMLFEWPAYCQI